MLENISDGFEALKASFLKISFETYNNRFDARTQNERRNVFEFMYSLISVPAKYNTSFYKFLTERIELPNIVACILFGSMNKLKGCNLNKKYGQLVYELKYSPKSLNMLRTVCSLCNIGLIEGKSLFGKPKFKLIFPQDFREYIISEFDKLPARAPQNKICSDETYNKFVGWWAEANEEDVKNDETLFGAYQVMCFYNEVCNGGFGQFWDFVEGNEWDLTQMKITFGKLLPEKYFKLFESALEAHVKGQDCEKYNAEFDSLDMEKNVLPKIANTVVGKIEKKNTAKNK